jgi:RTX calcium-binding nonapeptide repeat (4 copies)
MGTLQFHTLDEFAYRQALVGILKSSENPALSKIPDLTNATARGLRPHYDGNTNLAIGYGFDLFAQSFQTIQQRLGQVGVTFSDPASVQDALQQAKLQAQQIISQYGVNTKDTISKMGALGLQLGQVLALPNVLTAENLLKLSIEVREPELDNLLAGRGIPRDPITGMTIPFSQEREALVSLYYNSPSRFTRELTNALRDGERAEVWFQIRYNSNPNNISDIAGRRYAESNLFGLYGNQSVTESEARNVLKVAARHQFDIASYEGTFSPGGGVSITQQLSPAVTFLTTHFGEGQSLQRAFVAFSLGGDPIQGEESNDLLLGDIGHDILIGGGGDDLLRGKTGKDLYVINSGDGNDTIVDTASDLNGDGQPDGDGLGVVVLDQHLAQGGIRRQGEPTYTTVDETITYQWDGTPGSDLTITSAGSTITVKDFTNGKFGIQLTTIPASLVENPELPGVGRSEYLRIDHYVQVGNHPITGDPIFEPVYAPFFDADGNHSSLTYPALGGLTIPMGEENDLVHAGGGDATRFSSVAGTRIGS